LTLHDAVEEPDVEGYQMEPELQAANSSPESSPTEQLPEIPEQPSVPFQPTAVTPHLQQAQAAPSTEPEILMTTDVQTPGGQCRRLYSCIQAAASRLEDSTKDRSTQRVTRLTKLIQRSPKHLGK
jgi:hypothetical protein